MSNRKQPVLLARGVFDRGDKLWRFAIAPPGRPFDALVVELDENQPATARECAMAMALRLYPGRSIVMLATEIP